MRKLTISLLVIFLTSNTFSQDLLDIRIAFTPNYTYNGDYSNGDHRIQLAYNVSPQPGTLGLELGSQYIYRKSAKYVFNYTYPDPLGSPRNFGPIPPGWTGYSSSSYSSTSFISLFARLRWMSIHSKKLRIIPSVQFLLETQVSSSFFDKRSFSYSDGTVISLPNFGGRENAIGTNEGLFIVPELRLDYPLIPRLNLRIGLEAGYLHYITGQELRYTKNLSISGFLSTSFIEHKE